MKQELQIKKKQKIVKVKENMQILLLKVKEQFKSKNGFTISDVDAVELIAVRAIQNNLFPDI